MEAAITNQTDRRKGPDALVRSLRWLGLSGWVFLFGTLILIDNAKPEFETFFDRMFSIQLRGYWNESLIQWIAISFLFSFILGVSGLVFNLLRNRRRKDELRINLLFITGISALGLVYYAFLL